MAVIAPPRRPDSRDAEFTVEPDRGGEALIEEAKQHARLRRRRVAVTAIVASLAAAGAVMAALVAGGAGSSSSGPPPSRAGAEGPAVGAAAGEHVDAIASWAEFHTGWVMVFSDGRVLRAGAIGDVIREQWLSPAGLDLVRGGRVTAHDVWLDTALDVWPDDSALDLRGVWAAPQNPRSYVATEFAACPTEQRGINWVWIPATSVLHRLPSGVRDVVLGTQRSIPNVRFLQLEWPADSATELECFAVNSAQVFAIAQRSDEPSPDVDPHDLFTFTTGGAEPLIMVLSPVMPDGSVVRWGG